MTTAVDVANGHSEAGAGRSYLARKGLLSWLFTLDHKRIGIMYLVSVFSFFLLAGLLALAIRIELFTPASDFALTKSGTDYNKFFTLHGAIMVFLFIVPSIPATIGNFFLPLMLGAKDVAFPRLNLLSFHIYILGSLFLVYSIIAGSLDTGWTFYTPYSTETGTAVISATLGAFILGFSSILTGLNFIVTIHKMRAPGMTWRKMPLLLWGLYATSIIQVLATPVIGITLLLLVIERFLGIGIFDPALGGDPVLYQHFFWFYSHPVVYVMIVPAFGVISELVTVHSRKNIFGYSAIAYSSLAIALIGFLIWGHHMFVSGQSELASTIFSALTFAVGLPTAIKVFSWVATLYKGSIRFTAPMIYALSFIFTFTIGGLTGLFLGVLATDVHLHDTYFVVAHFHYVMMGGTVVAFFGAMHHWWPKMFGRWYNQKIARITAVFVFIGFNLTFFSQFVLGTHGMPRRYAQYADVSPDLLPTFTLWHQVSTVGSMILGFAIMVMTLNLVAGALRGKKAPANPWGGVSLEWETESPPIEHNFAEDPICTKGPYEFPEIEKSDAAHAH
jgi:cytochrome c oxidase subunit 1